MDRRRGAIAAALLMVCGVLSPALAGAAPRQPPPFSVPERRATGPSRLAPALHDELAAASQGLGPATLPGQPPGGSVTVVVEGEDLVTLGAAVVAAGGEVTVSVPGTVKARVPADALGRLAQARGVHFVRPPYALHADVQSEGVTTTGASAWHTGGFDGTGVRVAVVDLGFFDYASRLGNELPSAVETDFTRCTTGGPYTTNHGTGVAEIVHDMAPGATLRLVCVEDEVDLVSALGTMAANGVQVVNASIGLTVSNGARGDGSGAPGSAPVAVAALRQQGILLVESAGNYGGGHFHVNAVGDTPGDPGDFVDISPDDALAFSVPPGDTASVVARWDGWGTTQDFDLYLAQGQTLIDQSLTPQDQGGFPPAEGVSVTNSTGVPQTYELYLDRWSGTATPRVDFFFDGIVTVEHATGSSVVEPATSPSVMAVGATCAASGTLEWFSSRGPTIDGRVKPDITGPDAVSNSVYGPSLGCDAGFLGTSAAAPHVVGAAALLLDANPALDVAELQALLERRSTDAGVPGRDDDYGAGRLQLGAAGTAPAPTPARYSPVNPPTRLLDTRPGVTGAAEAPDRSAPLAPGEEALLQVAGIAGVPADATAVVLNVTVTTPTAGGYLTVFPDGELRPNSSNLNFDPGLTIANHVTATVGAGGRVRIFNPSGSSHVIVDVAGWYGPGGGGLFTALGTPARAVDTRSGVGGVVGKLGAGEVRTYQLAGVHGVPDTATAVALNVTVTGPTAASYLTVWPSGVSQPTVSSSNYTAGATIASLVVATLGPDDRVAFFNAAGATDLIVDIIGWFGPTGTSGYVPLDAPVRDLDTRTGTGPRLGPLGAGETYNLQAGRLYGVPGAADAIMINATAVAPTAGGYLTVFPAGQAIPNSSNLNFRTGQVIPNAVIAGLGAAGNVSIFNAFGGTHVLSDLSGYFAQP